MMTNSIGLNADKINSVDGWFVTCVGYTGETPFNVWPSVVRPAWAMTRE
jgi:hypothetical protein